MITLMAMRKQLLLALLATGACYAFAVSAIHSKAHAQDATKSCNAECLLREAVRAVYIPRNKAAEVAARADIGEATAAGKAGIGVEDDSQRGTASLKRVVPQPCARCLPILDHSSRLIPRLCDCIELLAISLNRVILDAKDRARSDELN